MSLSIKNKVYLFGFSYWKRKQIKSFFPDKKLYFCKSLTHAVRKGLSPDDQLMIWGRKEYIDVAEYARKHGMTIFRVEDGFLRSVTLGSDLTDAYSLVVDSRGIYFDSTRESDLEYILNYYDMDDFLLKRAEVLRNYLVEKRLSKYNSSPDSRVKLPAYDGRKKVILIPGQVEDDASIIYGADGMSNLELLQAVKEREPDAYLIYKPHPDVLAGNRKGGVPSGIAEKYVDVVLDNVSIDSALDVCDEVHTMTSLTGFEALMRGKTVTTYGMPFYAGWGVTKDIKSCRRRGRSRTLDELVAATYILYSRYLHPRSGIRCEVEELIKELEKEKTVYASDRFYCMKTNLRNWILRKIRLMAKVLLWQ